MKCLLKDRTESLLGYLNFIGITVLFLALVLFIITSSNNVDNNLNEDFLVLFFANIYVTHNRFDIELPYGKKKIGTFQVKKKYLLKHFIFSIKIFYTFQICLTSICLLILLSTNNLSWSIFIASFILIFIQLFSMSLSGITSYLSRLVHIISLVLIYLNLWGIFIVATILNFCFLYLGLIKRTYKNNSWIDFTYSKRISSNTFFIILKLIFKNIGITIPLGLLFMMMSFFGQYVLLQFQVNTSTVPILFLYTSIFLTIIEVLIGQRIQSIDIDLSLIRLQILNRISSSKAFVNSQLFLNSHLIVIIQVISLCGLIPLFLEVKTRLFWLNLILIPYTYLISFTYYKKAEYIVKRQPSLLKWSYLILYFIFMLIIVLGG